MKNFSKERRSKMIERIRNFLDTDEDVREYRARMVGAWYADSRSQNLIREDGIDCVVRERQVELLLILLSHETVDLDTLNKNEMSILRGIDIRTY